ncbi:MAG: hypothetical protein ACWA41_05415 [Putridiphycobacter sp.]
MISYCYKPNIFQSPVTFELDKTTLSKVTDKRKVMLLSDIVAINLFLNQDSTHHLPIVRCRIHSKNEMFTIVSQSAESIGTFKKQNDTFNAFVVQLHNLLPHKVALSTGVSQRYLRNLKIIFAVLVLAILGIAIGNLISGNIPIGFILIFVGIGKGILMSKLIKRYQPKTYTINELNSILKDD